MELFFKIISVFAFVLVTKDFYLVSFKNHRLGKITAILNMALTTIWLSSYCILRYRVFNE